MLVVELDKVGTFIFYQWNYVHRKIKYDFKNLALQKPYYLNNRKKCVKQPSGLITLGNKL